MDDNLYKYKKMSRFMLIGCVIFGLIGFGFVYNAIMHYYALPIQDAIVTEFKQQINELMKEVFENVQ